MTAEQKFEVIFERLLKAEVELVALRKTIADLRNQITSVDHRTTGMIRLGGPLYDEMDSNY